MASDEQFSLCWNNFHANMSAGFHGLLSRGDLVDVTLAAEGRLLQAHKLVLSVCSPYFQEMFKMNPTQHPIVFLKDVSHSALRDLLQFMYQGEVNVKQEELASFISTAEQLQVKGLTGNQNEDSSTPSKPKPTSRPGPRSSQQRQSIMTKLETDLDTKPSSTPVAIKRPNRPSIASNNSSSSQSGPKRKCMDPLEAGPSGSAKEEFVTIPDEDENNAVAPKMEPEFVNESMWDDDDEGANNDETNFGEDDSNMEMTGFDGSATGDGNITGGGEGGAVGDAQEIVPRRKKKKKKRTPINMNNLTNAIKTIKQNKITILGASKLFGIPLTTLRRHLKHCLEIGEDVSKLHENLAVKQVFDRTEERSLVEYLKDVALLQFGLTHKDVKILAYQFAKANGNKYPKSWDTNKMAGDCWMRLFKKRYENELSLRKPEITSSARSSAFRKHAVNLTFDKFKKVLSACPSDIKATDIWNVDETGLSAVHVPPNILAPLGPKEVGPMTNTERGTRVTMIAAVNAGGRFIPPMLIFPRVTFKDFMINGVPEGSIGGANPSGWSNESMFLRFLQHFIKYAKPSKEQPVILIMDNHESHISVPAIQMAKDNGVKLITLHPHTNDHMQPLVKSVFGPFKTYFNTAANELLMSSGHAGKPISIYDIAGLVGKAFPLAFTPNNICEGFSSTGFYPLNENIYTDADFIPSTPLAEKSPTGIDQVPVSQLTASGFEVIHGKLPTLVSPAVRPQPKAKPRKETRTGRQKRRSRILSRKARN
ncbi:uncharacterized protein mod(mdg4) isoform X1 [Epargyreus clarus]|uniref:uncharacterized protein mod(mdg4) isoform X1 n=1 Tax=Epargyreus clarus TaxID=520877 RepID=UPI003C301D7E